jgi:hypothetical protein
MKDKDQRLLEKWYQQIYEGTTKEPLYFGPKQKRNYWMNWLKELTHEVHEDGSVSVDGNVIFHSNFGKTKMDRVPFNFREVTGQYACPRLELTSLEGSPRIVTGTFDCSDNALTSLKGAPEIAKGNFYCLANRLTSLIGAPREIGKGFYCHNNERLTSLEGAPEVVGEIFTSDLFVDKDYRDYIKFYKLKDKHPELEGIF